ncbi:single-stranded DNA-binding protein [Rhizobium sp. YTU87027]|uniref:single-stranded DNA-binding protein n=1 Tax=Rhizobium sp. YTU87027 TaxID=3417741 RepID=UPI003D684C5B
MMQSAAYGRLGQEPRSIQTQSGNAMAVASIAVSVGEHDEPPLWIGILAFGKLADDLLRHQKGDMVSASGRVQRSSWTNSAGEKREQLQIVADSIISSRLTRPPTGQRREGSK